MSHTPGPWHFTEAKRMLNEIGAQCRDKPITLVEAIAVAQVHATLALAAATAMNGFDENGSAADDYNAWRDVCGARESTDG